MTISSETQPKFITGRQFLLMTLGVLVLITITTVIRNWKVEAMSPEVNTVFAVADMPEISHYEPIQISGVWIPNDPAFIRSQLPNGNSAFASVRVGQVQIP